MILKHEEAVNRGVNVKMAVVLLLFSDRSVYTGCNIDEVVKLFLHDIIFQRLILLRLV